MTDERPEDCQCPECETLRAVQHFQAKAREPRPSRTQFNPYTVMG